MIWKVALRSVRAVDFSDKWEGAMDHTRREFLKKSAATSALVWSAPVILSLPGAHAQATPVKCPEEGPVCAEEATALRVTAPIVGTQAFGVADADAPPGETVCVENVNFAGVTADLACGTTGPAECQSSATVTDLNVANQEVLAVSASVTSETISSEAHAAGDPDGFAPCTCGFAGSSFLEDTTVTVNNVPIVVQSKPDPNTVVFDETLPISGNNVFVIVNEQNCTGSTWVTRALRITVTNAAGSTVFEVVSGESELTGTNCTCP